MPSTLVKLRADRYLTGTQRSAELADFIVEDLKYRDYGACLEAYATLEKSGLDENDHALLAANDRFYLLTRVLARKDAQHPWVFDRCREVEFHTDGYLDLWAREHYKSTVITFAGMIQEIILDPEITIGLFSWSKSIATKFVRQVQQECEKNELLRTLFPDVFWWNPKKEAPLWSATEGLIMRRKSNPKEATLSGWGLDHQPTSAHFQLRVYDDVVTQKNVTNPEQIRKTNEGMELSDNLAAKEGRFWMIGTRYTFADTWGIQIERRIVKVRLYPATHNGRLDGQPVFFTQKKWDHKKRFQPAHIHAQMLQNPIAGKLQKFLIHWFQPWYVRPYLMNVYIMGDPSAARSKKSDRTAFAVVGVGAGGAKFFLDGARHRMNLSERWKTLKALHQKWSRARGVQSCRVGYEEYGVQADIEYFRERQRIENYEFGIEPLNWVGEGDNSKKNRVGRLQPDVQDGRFLFPGLVYHEVVGAFLHNYNEGDRGRLSFTNGEAYWTTAEGNNAIQYREALGYQREMMNALRQGQQDMMCRALKRQDEEGNIYDLTRCLFEEMLFFPVAPHDDLIDATSRVYDMKPCEPELWESTSALPQEDFWDA